MNRFLKVLFFLILVSINSFSQSKKQLIDSIIKANTVDSDCVGMGCRETEQFKNFKKLKGLLNDSEMLDLALNKNPVLRTYASIELIEKEKGNVVELFSNELRLNDYVQTQDGCLISDDNVSVIIYHQYWNKIRIKAVDEIAKQKVVEKDVLMIQLDSLVLYSEKEVDWLLYARSFGNRIYKENFLQRIEYLAFKKNNSFAFEYLLNNYPENYKIKCENYLINEFSKAKFKTETELVCYHSFVSFLLSYKTEIFNDIVINKLKNDENWKIKEGWFLNVLDEYNIKL